MWFLVYKWEFLWDIHQEVKLLRNSIWTSSPLLSHYSPKWLCSSLHFALTLTDVTCTELYLVFLSLIMNNIWVSFKFMSQWISFLWTVRFLYWAFFFLLICFSPLQLWILIFWQLYAFQIYSPRLWLYLFILFIAPFAAPRVINFNSHIWYFPLLYLFCILLKKFSLTQGSWR